MCINQLYRIVQPYDMTLRKLIGIVEYGQLFIQLKAFIKSLACSNHTGKPRLMAHYPFAKILAFCNFTIQCYLSK